MPAPSVPRPLRLCACLLAGLLAGANLAARADDLASVRQLQAAGQSRQALSEVRSLIQQRPADPQYRLTEALILQQLHEDHQAIEVLRALVARYPELPEPHNNLAVLYAARGEYALALEQLHMALRANPAYATASSNLGDLYLQLARQAYAQALRDGDAAAQQHARTALQCLQSAQTPARPATGSSAVPPATASAAAPR